MLERAPKPELVETKPVKKARKKPALSKAEGASTDQPDLLAAK
jgi:hypothetical protein